MIKLLVTREQIEDLLMNEIGILGLEIDEEKSVEFDPSRDAWCFKLKVVKEITK